MRGAAEVVTALVLVGLLGHGQTAPASVPPPPSLAPTHDGTGQVRVRVVSAKDQRPLAGVMVALLRDAPVDITEPLEAATTDARGMAFFAAAHAGHFNICARGAGHAESCEENVGLVAGGAVESALVLPPGASIRGQVLHVDGTPAVGVRVMAVGTSYHPLQMPTQAVTDFAGRYHLDGVSPAGPRVLPFDGATPRDVDVYLFLPALAPFRSEGWGVPRRISVEEGEQARLDIQLRGFAHVTVIPHRNPDHDWRGAPPESDDRIQQVWLFEGGQFTLPLRRQEDGTWAGLVEVGRRDAFVVGSTGGLGISAPASLDLVPGVHSVVEAPYVPDPPGMGMSRLFPRPREYRSFALAGHVLLPDGSPVSGARISVEKPSSSFGARMAEAPTHWHFRFQGSGFVVRPEVGSPRVVHAWLEDGRAGSVRVEGREGERVVADIRLQETGAVVGRVRLLSRWPFLLVPQLAVDGQDDPPLTHVELDGRFSIAGLAPGPHSLTVSGNYTTYRFVIHAGKVTDLGNLLPEQ
ncbi:hypothetical protein [Myxococcus landrumensis]|uniref:Carboxypeptidase regulatory-like domain-containing protein n=1 Tax=Myxococcus landrumensis TaxID=2813577 RepID=A0ABX7ND45_9BACT|nr:hypothetical protein [Myxococcus landrumus]QSQ16722.1 hypothetical protein JY572_12015 [Myxococcus landrumus]